MSVTSWIADAMTIPSRAGRTLTAFRGGLALCGLLAGLAAVSPARAAAPSPLAGGAARIARLSAAARHGLQAACPRARPGDARCFVMAQPQFAVNQALAAGRTTRPRGWTPQQLERAYRLPVNRRSHQTVAVSITGRTPHLGSYLRTYRANFGLPPCGQPSGCLRIVNQHGQAAPAAPSSLGTGWDVEATLDVSMISVACPHCKILVVEASSPSAGDLARSEDTAARLSGRCGQMSRPTPSACPRRTCLAVAGL